MRPPPSVLLSTFLAALALSAVNALPHALRRLPPSPRARLLSFAGGWTMAFVIMRLLPSLSQEAALVQRMGAVLPLPAGENVYAMALFSLLLFYGAEVLTRHTSPAPAGSAPPAGNAAPERSAPPERSARWARSAAAVRPLTAFRVELTTFALLYFLIGFTLLHRARQGDNALLTFFLAMFLKFVVSDHALHDQHQEAYDRIGRWVLAAAVLLGWGLGVLLRLPDLGPALLEAFIAGGVIFNILRWELPRSRQSRYWPFALGAVAYAALLTVV